MTEEEVEIERAVTVVVRLGTEQADSTVAGVCNDQRRVRFVGRRQAARVLELVRPGTTRTEPSRRTNISHFTTQSSLSVASLDVGIDVINVFNVFFIQVTFFYVF